MNRFQKFILIILSVVLAGLFSGCQSDEPDDIDVPHLSQIELTKPASKLIYKKGDSLDTSGLEVTAVYRSGRSSVVTGWTVIGFDSAQDVASQTLTVIYQENGVSRFTQYQIQYSNLSGISISHPANKLIYAKGDELDTTGLVVMASYKNGMSQVVSGWTVDGFDSAQDVASQTLTVTYAEGDISYSVQYQIQYSNLDSIAITDPAKKLIYTKASTKLDTDGLEITARYTNGKSQKIPLDNAKLKFSGFDPSQDVPNQTIIITYEEGGISRFTEYQIQYSNLTGISISHPAVKLIYSKGDELDITGLKITASYKNGMSQIVNVTKDNVTGFDSSQDVSNQTLTVTYTEGDLSYSVQYQIQYSNLSGISISHPADKLIYTKGEELDITGLKITASYKNGMSQIVNVTKDNITGFDSSRDVTSQTLTVTYAEGDLSYSVQYQIQYSNLSGISVTTPPRKTKYRVGDYAGFDAYKNRDFINLDELVLTVSRTDGNSEIIDFSKIESDVLVKDENGRIMIEFLNDTMTGPCKNYYDIPKTKTIDLGNNRSIGFSGFAFIKEDTSPQINIIYTEECNGAPLTRSTSFGISVNYEPNYEFTKNPKVQDGVVIYGDYPQSEKTEDVIVCNKSIDKGMFKYYVASNGKYYVKYNDSYYQVEPVKWVPITCCCGQSGCEDPKMWASLYVLDGGLSFSKKMATPLQENVSENVRWKDNDDNWQFATKNYTLNYHSNNYEHSVIANFLNGTPTASNAFSNKGFYQTAFDDESAKHSILPNAVAEYVYATEISTDNNSEYSNHMKTYTQYVVIPNHNYNFDNYKEIEGHGGRTNFAAARGAAANKMLINYRENSSSHFENNRLPIFNYYNDGSYLYYYHQESGGYECDHDFCEAVDGGIVPNVIFNPNMLN